MGALTFKDPLAGQSFYPQSAPVAVAPVPVPVQQPDIDQRLMTLAHAFMPAPKVNNKSPHWMQFVSQAMQQAQNEMQANRQGPSMAGTYAGLAGTTQVTPEDAARIAQAGIERMKLEQGFADSQDQNAYRQGMLSLEQQKQAAEEARQADTPNPMNMAVMNHVMNALTQQNTQEQMNKYEQARQLAVAKQNLEAQGQWRADAATQKAEQNRLDRENKASIATQHNETLQALKAMGGSGSSSAYKDMQLRNMQSEIIQRQLDGGATYEQAANAAQVPVEQVQGMVARKEAKQAFDNAKTLASDAQKNYTNAQLLGAKPEAINASAKAWHDQEMNLWMLGGQKGPAPALPVYTPTGADITALAEWKKKHDAAQPGLFGSTFSGTDPGPAPVPGWGGVAAPVATAANALTAPAFGSNVTGQTPLSLAPQGQTGRQFAFINGKSVEIDPNTGMPLTP